MNVSFVNLIRRATRTPLALSCFDQVGTFVPFYAVWLLLQGGSLAALGAGLTTVLVWPFVFNVKAWPAAARFWVGAAAYFDGGCSIAFEERTPNDMSVRTCTVLGALKLRYIPTEEASVNHAQQPWPHSTPRETRLSTLHPSHFACSFQIPTMQCYHPHGVFTLGLIMNSGIRCTAAEHKPGCHSLPTHIHLISIFLSLLFVFESGFLWRQMLLRQI